MRLRQTLFAAALAAGAAPALAQEAVSEETMTFFKQNCASCHTIGGGPLAGPDLKGATDRRTKAQLAAFIADPKAAIDSGDEYLQKLWRDMKTVYMPALPSLTKDRIEKLLGLIEAESKLEKSHFMGLQISDRPLTAADVRRGERLFAGEERFASGAPACASCHSVSGMPGFGGGRLGPDLSDAYGRIGDRKTLPAWLSAPPTPTMGPVFARTGLDGEEILALTAYLKDRKETGGGAPADGSGRYEFLLAGVAGLVGSLALFDFFWRRRFTGVRRRLVEGSRR